MSTETKEQRIERIADEIHDEIADILPDSVRDNCRVGREVMERIHEAVLKRLSALTALCEEMEREKWQAIADAPVDGTEVRLLLKSGRTLTASLLWGFVDSNNRDCACWVCSDEDECPECWTDGACWEVNADGKPSDQPTHWQTLPQPPAT